MRRRRQLISAERGFALVIAVTVLLISLLLLAATATRVLQASDTSNRDAAGKRALQAAESGLRVAAYRTNTLSLDLNQLLNPAQQCVASTSGLLGVQALAIGSTWCPAVAESLGGGASWSYWMSSVVRVTSVQGLTTRFTLTRKIVSVGTVNGASRRLYSSTTISPAVSYTTTVLGLIGTLHLGLYKTDPGSYKECSPGAAQSPPDAGC